MGLYWLILSLWTVIWSSHYVLRMEQKLRFMDCAYVRTVCKVVGATSLPAEVIYPFFMWILLRLMPFFFICKMKIRKKTGYDGEWERSSRTNVWLPRKDSCLMHVLSYCLGKIKYEFHELFHHEVKFHRNFSILLSSVLFSPLPLFLRETAH